MALFVGNLSPRHLLSREVQALDSTVVVEIRTKRRAKPALPERAGDGGALLLAAGKIDPAFAQDGLKLTRQLLDVGANLG